MIHKIKALYDEGRGSSLHAIAVQMGISRNTVRKYLAMSAAGIAAYQGQRKRPKRLDGYRDYIVHLLATYPRLTAVKVLRKLHESHGDLRVSAGSAASQTRCPNAVSNHLHFCMAATTITWLYATQLPQAPKRRYAAQRTTEFAFADVRRALAMTLDGEGFGIDCPPTGKPPKNPLIAAVLRLVA